MKKLNKLLLSITLICTLLIVFAVPVFAAPKQGVGVIDITKDIDFSSTLENLVDNQIIVFNLKKDIWVDHEIVIKANNCSILIRVDDTYYAKYGDAKIYPNYRTDDAYFYYYRFLRIEGDNTKLYFDGHVICQDFEVGLNPHVGGDEKGAGAAIYIHGDNCLIANAIIHNCRAVRFGGGIIVYYRKGANIRNCTFKNCRAAQYDGGAICVFGDSPGSVVYQCNFIGNLCETEYYRYGDDVSTSENNTTIQNCTSDSKRNDNFDDCFVAPDTERTPMDTGADIFGTDFSNDYRRPIISAYAQSAIDNNKQCDVIRPDLLDTVESDNEHFTLEGKNVYGALWQVDYQNALTIKAKEGYTITRIEGVVTSNQNYKGLKVDKGTKKDLIDNPSYFGDWIERNFIAGFDDINSDSVTLSTSGDNTNNNAVQFSEFIVYYTQDTTLGSVFSSGTLWIIIGVIVVAAVAAVVIIQFVNKKKKSLASNDAVVEKTDEEDD